MDRYWSKIGSHSFFVALVIFSTTACTAPKNIALQAPISPPSSAPTLSITASQPPVRQNDGELYQEALTKADAAKAIGESALSKDDWFLVANNLQNSVEMLKSITPTSSQYILAAKVLPK
jgi:hypothetical protein